MKKYFTFLTTVLLTVLTAGSQTTWTGSATGGDWSLGSNWSSGNAPGINDDVVLDGGISGTIFNIKDGDIRSLTVNGNSTITLDYSGGGAARALRINDEDGVNTLDFSVTAGSHLTLAGTNFKGISLSNRSEGDAGIDGTLTINSGLYYIGTNTRVTGIIDNKGVLAGYIIFFAGSSYIHSQNGGRIPYPVGWNIKSNCIISGIVNQMPDLHNLNKQNFGNFIWDCPNQLPFNASFAGLLTDIAGNFVIKNTGTGSLYMPTVVQSGGMAQVGGDFIMEGGTLVPDQGSIHYFLIINGGFKMSGGFLQKLATETTRSLFTFSGGKIHSFSKTGGTISGEFDFDVEAGDTIDFGVSVLDGSTGTFRLKDGAKIITSHADGLNSVGALGSVQTTNREFSPAADYEFRGANTGIFNTGISTDSDPSVVRNLTINNPNGAVILSKPVIVSNPSPTEISRFFLKEGVLITTAFNLLTLNDNVQATGVDLLLPNQYNLTSYVDGPLRKTGDDEFIFPVGKSGTGLVPVGINDITGNDQAFTAEYKRETPPDPAKIAASTFITHLSRCEYWTLDRNGVSTADVSFYWNTNNACDASPYITQPSSLKAVHYNTTTNEWNATSPASGIGTNTAGSVTWDNVNEFSPFAFGTTSLIENPLPVVFADLKIYENNGVFITWSNLAEKDVAEYIVERSTNGMDFVVVARQIPANNYQEKASYRAYDPLPAKGINYYRLKATEQTGKIFYSTLLRIDINKNVKEFALYPNPVTDNHVTVSLSKLKQGKYELVFINALGQQVYKGVFNNPSGNSTQIVNIPLSVKPGIYKIILRSGDYQETKSLLVQ